MRRELIFTDEALETLAQLQADPARSGLLDQVRKTLGLLETNLRHPSLQTHEHHRMSREVGQKVFEAYAQQKTPAAYRVFFVYGPDIKVGNKNVPRLTVVSIARHG